MTISASLGRKAGAAFAFGVCMGSLFWGILAGFGLSIVILHAAWLFSIIKVLGGAYLLWLAFKFLRSAVKPDAMLTDVVQPQGRKLFLQGLALHLTNPKAVFVWVSVITIAMPQATSSLALFGFVAVCNILAFTIFLSYALLFSTVVMQRLYKKARRPISAIAGLMFGAAGTRILSS